MNDYTEQLKKLMPTGRAFDLSSESNLTKLLAGLASELTLIDSTAGTIPDELTEQLWLIYEHSYGLVR